MSLLPFDDRDGTIWLDGRLVPWQEAKLHVLTHGLHYASSVFEGIRAYAGHVFALREHCQRLIDSAGMIGFDLPYDIDELQAATHATLQANGIADGYLRPVAWRGSEQMSIAAPASKVHVAIAAWDWPSYYDPKKRMAGIRMHRSRWARPAPNTAPSAAKAAGLYMICTMAKHEALAAGYDDALMLDWRGLIAEATGANIFLVVGDRLLTPTPDCFLDGITRRTVMDLARRMGIEVVERPIAYDELGQAVEVFLTGTAAEITPVRQIDDFQFRPGDFTSRIMRAYSSLVRGESADLAPPQSPSPLAVTA